MKTSSVQVFCLINNRLFGLRDFRIPAYHRPWPFMARQRGAYLHFFTEALPDQLEVRQPNTSPAMYGGYLPGFAFNHPGRQLSQVAL